MDKRCKRCKAQVQPCYHCHRCPKCGEHRFDPAPVLGDRVRVVEINELSFQFKHRYALGHHGIVKSVLPDGRFLVRLDAIPLDDDTQEIEFVERDLRVEAKS